MSGKPFRQRFWHRHPRTAWATTLLFFAVVAMMLHAWLWLPRQLVLHDVPVPVRAWPAECDRLRVDLVSDTHTGSFGNGVDKLDRWVANIARGDADLVVLAGDFVILSVAMGEYIPASTIAPHLAPITRTKPTFGVLGNHDWWKGGREVSEAFSRGGVTMLNNASQVVDVRGCRFNLVGVDDAMAGQPNVPRAFAGVDASLPTLAIVHEPSQWPDLPRSATLTLSGHTHGGQVNPFSVFSPRGYQRDSHFLRGVYREDGRTLMVTSGIGTSILPLRLGVPPEIARLTLRSEAP